MVQIKNAGRKLSKTKRFNLEKIVKKNPIIEHRNQDPEGYKTKVVGLRK